MVRQDRAVARVDLSRGGEIKRHDAFGQRTLDVWFNSRAERTIELRTNRTATRFFAVHGKDDRAVPIKLGFTPDGNRSAPLWVGIGDEGGKLAAIGIFDSDYTQFQEFDTRTGERLPRDARLPADRDIESWISGAASDEVLGVTYTDEVPRQLFFDEALQAIHASVSKALSGQAITVLSWSNDRSAATLSAAAPGQSETYYVFERKQGTLSPLGEARPQLASLPKPTTISLQYSARDRLPIESFVTLPAGKRRFDGPFPLIVMPRDQLRGRSDARFDWWVQFFAQRGYAVFRPNARGSTGYGKAFLERGSGEFGGAIVDDVVEGARFAVSSGLAERNRICFAGIGYGGYVALMASLREPDMTRCVIAVNAIIDPVSVYDRLRYTAAGSYGDWQKYLGDRPGKTEAAALSPAFGAWRFSTPLLLLYDSRETIVTAGQLRDMKKQMALHGRSPEWVQFDSGDPMFVTAAARSTVLSASDAFLAKHLGQSNVE